MCPWRVEITGAVRTKGNQLEVEVANLWPNRLIGDQTLPTAQRLTWTTWNPFTKGSPLLESGLLGPVSLVSEGVKARGKPKRVGASDSVGQAGAAPVPIANPI